MKKRLAISRTVIPLDYDKSIEGFNKWCIEIKNDLLLNTSLISIEAVIPEVKKILKFHTPINRK